MSEDITPAAHAAPKNQNDIIQAVIQKAEARPPAAQTSAGAALIKQVMGESAKPEPEKKPETPREPASKHFVALSKQERALQAKRAEFAAEKKALETERAQIAKDKEDVQRFNERRGKAKLDPVNAVRDLLGLEYADLTEAILNDGNATPDQKVAALAKEIENLRSEGTKKEEGRRAAEIAHLRDQEAREVHTWRQGISDFLQGNAEKYEGIALFQVGDMVPELIRHHFAETKKLLTNEAAAGLIEETLWDHVEKATKGKRWTEKVKAATASKESKPEASGSKKRTLTEEQRIALVIAKAEARTKR